MVVRRSFRLPSALGIPLIWVAALAFAHGTTAYGQSEQVDFNRDVRPILSNVCFKCHGPDAGARKKDLRLDLEESAIEERDGVRAIVPGDPAASAMVQRITHSDPDERMPPQNQTHKLSQQDIDVIIRWIKQGAEYDLHWAYTAVNRPPVPNVKQADWVSNPIDNFILNRLESEGLQPSAEADPVTLTRRMFVDLTGLPPKPEDVRSFETDGHEPIVDRLMASQHYGERMAVTWLDLVRYADSAGYHNDPPRSIWPYRDYVINAFNNNKPFDEFTTEQLAGDLLENATQEDLVASGYNRLNQTTGEGGAQAKEYLAIYSADRVRTTAAVWLGSTFLCAQCHDHKYDPITMKDFYSFAAFFADIEEQGVYAGPGTTLTLKTKEGRAREQELRAAVTEAEKGLAIPDSDLTEERNEWIEGTHFDLMLQGIRGWAPVQPTSIHSESGSTLELQPDFSVLSTGEFPDRDTYTIEIETGRKNVTGLRLEALTHESFGGGLTRDAPFIELSEFEVFTGTQEDGNLAKAEIAELLANDKEIIDNRASHLAIDGNLKTGWHVNKIWPGKKAVIAVKFANPIEGGPGTKLTVRMHHQALKTQTLIGRFRISLTTAEEVAADRSVDTSEPVLVGVTKAAQERSEEATAQINAHYRLVSPRLEKVQKAVDKKQGALSNHVNRYPRTLVTKSVEPRTIRILPRGNWMDDSGEIMSPAIPEFLGETPMRGERVTRLDLADWLVSRDNPLTARVFVNRLWKELFGKGLSSLMEDVGAQGKPPTHPELLDWLAVEFMESGWDVKHMVRLMTTSATYRQASTASAALRELDPFNRLLARQSRVRYGAEAIRDTALALSGLLVPEIGGRSVRPYQPAGYYAHMNFPKRTYQVDSGKNLFRRGLYTHWQRTFLHPSMLTFDAPSREECTADRPVSNTPQQALVLLNDPIYGEAARVFAARILHEGFGSDDQRINWAVEQAISRKPDSRELNVLRTLLEKHTKQFRGDAEAAKAALQVGVSPVPEDIDPVVLAAWTSVARVILNLAEVITRS